MLYANANAIANRSGSPISALRGMVDRIGASVWPLLVAGARAWIAHGAERHLMERPDHLLKDIGLARSDIRRAVRGGRA